MPDTPDLDTLDLPGLLALWAERYPGEVTCRDVGHYVLHGRTRALATFLLDEEFDEMDDWLIEGHARACIERLGYTVEITSYTKDDNRYHVTVWNGDDAQGPVSMAPSLAVALVRLRLSLPKPADR